MKKNYRIGLFNIVTALFWFSMYTYAPTLSTYSKSLGATYKMIGLIVGSYGFTQMFIKIPIGIISDKLFKRKIFVIIGISISLLSCIGFFYSSSTTALLIFRSLDGFAAASWVVFTVLYSSYYKEEEATKAIGIVNSFNSLGVMTAIFLGGLTAQYLGPKAPFGIAALGGVAALILGLFITENEGRTREQINFSEILTLLKNRNFLTISILAVLTQFITFATVYGFTPMYAKQIGANDFQLGLLTTLSTLPGIFASLLSGTFFAKRFGERKTIIGGFIICAASCILIPYINSIALLYLSQMISGFGWGGVFPLLMGLSIKNIEANKRATAMGLYQAIFGLGMFLGPLVVGFLGDFWGLTAGFWFTGMIGITAALLTGCLKKT